MLRVLVTGMSGTGKSSALRELSALGFDTVDTDEPGWTLWSHDEDGYVWDERRVGELLDGERDTTLFVSGTVSNQGRFYPRFDAVVLLSAPADTILRRIAERTTNPYGKAHEERRLVLEHLAEVEPLLRATCTHEIDAAQPLRDVVAELVGLPGVRVGGERLDAGGKVARGEVGERHLLEDAAQARPDGHPDVA